MIILGKDSSFETYSPVDGEDKPIARFHKDLALDVDTGIWYIYHHRLFDTEGYNPAKWREL